MVDVMIDKSKLINESNVRLTKQLFIEYDHISDKDHAVYTLAKFDKEVNGKTYPSLYRLYMEVGDITEAAFVEKYLYDWEQWERIQKSPALAEEVEQWRRDLRKKLSGQLVEILVNDAFDERSKSRTASAKYLLDNIVKPNKTKATRGRPSHKETDKSDNFHLEKEIAADLERIRNRKNGTA